MENFLTNDNIETRYEGSQYTKSQENNILASDLPSVATINDALTKIRLQGRQNLVAIPPEGGAPVAATFELPTEIEAAGDWAANQNRAGNNVYFTVNPVKERLSKKPTKDDIAGAEYAHVDIDPNMSAGYDEGRRRLLGETLPALMAFDPAPSLISDTGNGLGVFWRLDGATIEQAEDLNARLIGRFGGDVGTHNIDRLMRLPGTLNYPSKKKLDKGYPAEPRVARLLVANPGVCSLEQLGAALPAVEIKAAAGTKPAAQDRPVTSICLTPDGGRAAERLLDAALARNDLLRSRWEGSTVGLQDTSRSAMDFSVTALLKLEGFNLDEVAYLLVNCFKHGKGAENDERSILRCWENTGVGPGEGVRGWVNNVFTAEEAATAAGLDPGRFAGANPYGVLLRGLGSTDEVVRRAHERALAKLNETFAKTMIGGKVAIIREYVDPSFEVPTYAAMTPGQFVEWWRGQQAFRVGKSQDPVQTNLGKDWLDWPGKRQYRAMTFKPGPVSDDVYNTWTGFPVEPKQGDWSLMQQLIKAGLCSGNEEHYTWLLDWMAAGIQRPAERHGVAAVFRGAKGVGKGQFAKWYGRLFGTHFLHLSNSKHLVGNFNAHLERTLLVFADELIWGGNKQQEGPLKALVTEETIPIERKGWDVELRKNYTRLLVASNEDWAVPAGVGERRWFVLDVSAKFKGDFAFFEGLNRQMETGGLEAMMYDLMNREITTNQRLAPSTTALADIAVLSLDDVSSWLHELLSGGVLPLIGAQESFAAGIYLSEEELRGDAEPRPHAQARRGWPYAATKHTLYESFAGYSSQHQRYHRVRDRASFFKRLGQLLPSATETRPRIDGKQSRVLELPTLVEARAEFQRTTGLNFDFDAAE